MKAILLLADGTIFEGESIGASGTTIGESVFATAMTGYQEMLTDPSFAGQLLTLTYPLVGNYGVNTEDVESGKIQVEGFIVRELCEEPSNWRSSMSLREYLTSAGVVSMQGIDTRALTRHLRVSGVMMGAMSTELTTSELKNALESAPNYGDLNFVQRVSTSATYEWTGDECSKLSDLPDPKCHIALIDLGIKRNIARCLAKEGCKVTILSCNASADDVLRVQPDGVVFSPGPGDPRQLKDTVATMRTLIGKKPILGICLGHQMFGMAMGGNIIKLKFGHRGANHPVKNIINGRVSITSQNHGYAVHPDKLSNDVQVERINLNDGTVEGLRHKHLPIFTIQYHPEASAGPLDEGYLFKDFVNNVMAAK
ncbi:MAG: glutamine-hydrolyzing carbamoyl-phosphate synthase small subunit [Armatimonadota bacterium]|nr:glutamine-hydrolyzing carbamoyl-phosphate synthase small subunit [bacterium]